MVITLQSRSFQHKTLVEPYRFWSSDVAHRTRYICVPCSCFHAFATYLLASLSLSFAHSHPYKRARTLKSASNKIKNRLFVFAIKNCYLHSAAVFSLCACPARWDECRQFVLSFFSSLSLSDRGYCTQTFSEFIKMNARRTWERQERAEGPMKYECDSLKCFIKCISPLPCVPVSIQAWYLFGTL